MRWEDCLENKVFERKKDISAAESLFSIAKIRIKDNEKRERTDDNVPLIVEAYWEIIKQLITASLTLDGYKSYSQECLVSYLEEFYEFSHEELELIDELREVRNDIDYRGRYLQMDYLNRKEDKIQSIISKLEEKVEERLD
ncbi:MAG: hypothetical protein ACLFVL_02195 [Candidatus Aenigmatarchaeota archaeon]